MRIVPQSFEILNIKTEAEIISNIAYAARTCYKSYTEDKDNYLANSKFIKNVINRGHESVLEHESIRVKMTVDRGVLAELTRHRIGVAYSVESTRYCNYGSDDISFIDPTCGKFEDFDEEKREVSCGDYPSEYLSRHGIHLRAYLDAEEYYNTLISCGATPQEARQVLPMALATDLVMTANIREWRHILKLRTSTAAHPYCRDIFGKILATFADLYPVLFGDLFLEKEAPVCAECNTKATVESNSRWSEISCDECGKATIRENPTSTLKSWYNQNS